MKGFLSDARLTFDTLFNARPADAEKGARLSLLLLPSVAACATTARRMNIKTFRSTSCWPTRNLSCIVVFHFPEENHHKVCVLEVIGGFEHKQDIATSSDVKNLGSFDAASVLLIFFCLHIIRIEAEAELFLLLSPLHKTNINKSKQFAEEIPPRLSPRSCRPLPTHHIIIKNNSFVFRLIKYVNCNSFQLFFPCSSMSMPTCYVFLLGDSRQRQRGS
jgi:hypothetical protein